MTEHPINEYMKGRRQQELADALGMTQGAISQLLRSGRNVMILTDDSGEVKGAYERRPLGSHASIKSPIPAA